MSERAKQLEQMLQQGNDNALLRYSLGSEYLQQGAHSEAVMHLAQAVALEPNYSAAWKLYGRALVAQGKTGHAARVYEQGIRVATKQGDKQAEKEMQVFLRRIKRPE